MRERERVTAAVRVRHNLTVRTSIKWVRTKFVQGVDTDDITSLGAPLSDEVLEDVTEMTTA